MSEIADAISGTVGDMFGGGPVAETEDTVQVAAPEAEVAPDTATQAEVAPEADSWDFEAAGRDLFADDPEEIPDFDALAEQELGGQEQTEDQLAPSEYDDDTTRELKRQLLAERKRAEHFQRRHLDSSRKAWEQDVRGQPWGRFLPQDLSQIKASSHREFIRQAKTVARTNYDVLKPHFEKLEQEKARLREQATTEAREVATRAWGSPQVGGSHVPDQAPQQDQERLQAAVRSRSMVNVVKEYINQGII